MIWRKCFFDCFLCQIHVFLRKKLNYTRNINEGFHNGNTKLLNVLKFYFDLKKKKKNDTMDYTTQPKLSPFNISRLTNMNDMKRKKWDILRYFMT